MSDEETATSPQSEALRLREVLQDLKAAASWVERRVHRLESPENATLQHAGDDEGKALAEEFMQRNRRRGSCRSSVLGGTVQLTEWVAPTDDWRPEEVETSAGATRVAPAGSDSLQRQTESNTIIGEQYSTSPTENKVRFEPRLVGGLIGDAPSLKDRLRHLPLLNPLVHNFLQPLVFFLSVVPVLLLPAWGPFALAEMTAQSLISGASGWASFSLGVMAVYAAAATVFHAIIALDFHTGTVRLVLSESKFTLLANLGTRLVYTVAAVSYFAHPANVLCLVLWMMLVAYNCFYDALQVTHMLRYSREGYAKFTGNSLAGWLTGLITTFEFSFELARHVAVLYVLDSGLSSTIEFLPESVFGSSLRLTNVHLLNVSFSTSMVLCLRMNWVRFSKNGKEFVMVNAPITLQPVYAEDT